MPQLQSIFTTAILKKYLIGNIIVATMTGLTFIYGASLFGFNTILIIPFSFAFLIMFSREVLKTIEDVEEINRKMQIPLQLSWEK